LQTGVQCGHHSERIAPVRGDANQLCMFVDMNQRAVGSDQRQYDLAILRKKSWNRDLSFDSAVQDVEQSSLPQTLG
jgi:hypothetical protein